MFTGIIETTGKLMSTKSGALEISTTISGLEIGDSIAVNGVCLTVVSTDDTSFTVNVSEETLRRATLGKLHTGRRVNLERPVAAGDRFGGHIVQGHVDGTGRVLSVDRLDASTEMTLAAEPSLLKYVVEKGSIAVDGVSLTVTGLRAADFSVALIPHTLEVTNLGDFGPGDEVNLEVDVMAKYVEKLVKPFRSEQ